MKRTLLIITAIALATIALSLVLVVSIPFLNDYTAYSVKKDLMKVPLPEKTEIVDAVSSARKLTGNGNGMQFFGAILIKSELTLEQLNNYYSKFREDDWSYIVERQENNRIDFIEHGDLFFKALNTEETLTNHYIVYTWGSSNYPLSDFDLRGH